MSADEGVTPQGPVVGSRCLAGPGGHWGRATIRRVNEDGSFKVEFDVKDMVVLPYWYGVTPAEVSFDDARQWPSVFAQLCPSGSRFSRAQFPEALTSLGLQAPPEEALAVWDRECARLSGTAPPRANRDALTEAEAYELFLLLGLSAKQCAENLRPGRPEPFFKMYWNQIRMGGREPSEVTRPVTTGDAIAALGLTAERVDRSAVAYLRQFEREHGVRLPAALTELLGCAGVGRAVTDCHPNNPYLVEFRRGMWELRRGMRERRLDGEYALGIMLPHQGDHKWAVVFDDGDADARVYVHGDSPDGGVWLRTAPGIGVFFWDLAQTGLCWYQDTRFKGGKPVEPTDIGLVPRTGKSWWRFWG